MQVHKDNCTYDQHTSNTQTWLTATEILRRFNHPIPPLPHRNPIGIINH